jgi:hypothetical protein
MALLNTNGSVAKAWPVVAGDRNGNKNDGTGSEKSVGNLIMAHCRLGRQRLSTFSLALLGLVHGQVIPDAPVMLVVPMIPRLTAHIQEVDIYPHVAAHQDAR